MALRVTARSVAATQRFGFNPTPRPFALTASQLPLASMNRSLRSSAKKLERLRLIRFELVEAAEHQQAAVLKLQREIDALRLQHSQRGAATARSRLSTQFISDSVTAVLLFLDLHRSLGLDLGGKLGLQFDHGCPQWLVNWDLLTESLERQDK